MVENHYIEGWNRDHTIGSILSCNIEVPQYQREFAWNIERIEDFIDDLIEFYNGDQERYLFGQVILYEEDEKYYVIDGQQRLATCVIFLSVLRDIATKINTEDSLDLRDHEIVTKHIGNVRRGMNDFKLTLGGNNKIYFAEHIQTPDNLKPNPLHVTNKKIAKAYKKIYDAFEREIMGKIRDPEVQYRCLKKFYEKLTNGFFVSRVVTKNLPQAFVIFETLNARGTPLSVVDLLKNYFFKMDDGKRGNVKSGWTQMTNSIERAKGSASQYIRYFWNSQGEFCRERGLFRKITENIKSKEMKNFLESMYNLADTYVSLINPPGTAFENKNLVKSLISLRKMGVKSFYPVVLAMKSADWDEENISKVVRYLESLFFRNVIVVQNSPNEFEKEFSEWSNKITNSEIDVEELCKAIQNKIVGDDEFKDSFIYLAPSESRAKFIIRELCNFSGEGVEVSDDPELANLEHIMPKNYDKWAGVMDERKHKEYRSRLGNLTYIHSKDNSAGKDELFDVKKPYYEKSLIYETKLISDYDRWDAETIETRQKTRLFELANKRWPKVYY